MVAFGLEERRSKQEGDAAPLGSDSFEALYRAEYDAMVRLAYLLTRNRHDAEEIVQEGFVDVERRWASLLNPGGYLRTAVVNGSRRHLRRSRRRRSILRSQPPPSASVGSGEYDHLIDALDKLPERHRVAIVLAYYYDYTSAEIAETLECRPGTAKSLVHRGLRYLRNELDDE